LIEKRDACGIFPEIVRVIAVSVSLAVVAEEFIEALVVGIAFCAGPPQSPFAECSGGIAAGFEYFSECDFGSGDGQLALGLCFAVVANPGMSRVFAGQEYAA
jgi:hypothetical protein